MLDLHGQSTYGYKQIVPLSLVLHIHICLASKTTGLFSRAVIIYMSCILQFCLSVTLLFAL